MHLRIRALRLLRRVALVLPFLVLVASACSPDHYPQTALLVILSDFGKIGDDIQTTTFYWALGVFVLVEGALLYAIFRFRGSPDDPEPRQVHGNTTVEFIWTVIPALILAAIAVPTVRGIFETARPFRGRHPHDRGHGASVVVGVPLSGPRITTANELHIPVGRRCRSG